MQLNALVFLLTTSTMMSESCSEPRRSYFKTSGVDCVTSNFSKTVTGVCTELDCSLLCDRAPRCQAFSLNAWPPCLCKLFVFDECSHRVQSVANCTNQVTVYVRSQAGVQPGRLCPPGYLHTRYGTSYKVVTSETVNWETANQRCSKEAGLSKSADAIDLEEAKYLCSLKQLTSGTQFSYWIGGHLLPGATVNAKPNWHWVTCNQSVSDVWNAGEPNAGLDGGCADLYLAYTGGISDWACTAQERYICECQSVF